MSPVKCLIIGYGSIGSRHAIILKQLGCSVHVVTSRSIDLYPRYAGIQEAFWREKHFDYVVISNRTSDHSSALKELNEIGYHGLLLIEKPVFRGLEQLVRPVNPANVFIAYNLRGHPIIQDVHSLIHNKKIFSIQIYAGSYLPDWRPDTDYKQCYSAIKSQGGGVLRDLSHELDYLCWFTGCWKSVAALGGKFGHLQIDSDDVFALLIETERCPAAVLQFNYLDRVPRREMLINIEDQSLRVDLIENTLSVNQSTKKYTVQRNDTHLYVHKAILERKTDNLCSFEDSLKILHLIQGAEEAAISGVRQVANPHQ